MKPQSSPDRHLEYEQFGDEVPLLASGDSTVRPRYRKILPLPRAITQVDDARYFSLNQLRTSPTATSSTETSQSVII